MNAAGQKALFEWIARFESLHRHAYPDPASPLGLKLGSAGIRKIGEGGMIPTEFQNLKGDPWTIGYGQTGPEIRYGLKWSLQQAQDALKRECLHRARLVERLVKVPININQTVALASLHFNIGVDNFAGSTLLRKLNAFDYQGAADEFPRWKFAQGRVMPGLVARRAAERALFMAGQA